MRNNNLTILKVVITTCLSVFLLTGCFSSYEPNEIAYIDVLGIDLADNGEYEITLLTFRPEAMFPKNNSPSGSRGNIIDSPILLTTTTGKNIMDAYEKNATIIAKRLSWAHMNSIVFGEAVAKKGIGPIFDSIIRNYNFRPNYQILITKGKAKDILETKPLTENSLGAEIYNINRYSRLHSTPIVNNVAQFLNFLGSETTDPFTAKISRASSQGIHVDELGGGPQINSDQMSQPIGISLDGLAVFKRDQLRGWLNYEEARSVGFVRGEVPESLIILNCPNNDGTISVETNNVSSSLKPKSLNGKLQMDVNVTIDATLREVTCSSLRLDSNQMKTLNSLLEQKVKKDIKNVLTIVQSEWQADIFGFGETIYKHMPTTWNELAPTWRSGGLKDMPVHVKVDANIARTGLLHSPIKANESR